MNLQISKRFLIASFIFVFLMGWSSFDLFHQNSGYKIALVDLKFIVSQSVSVKLLNLQQQQQKQELQTWFNHTKDKINQQKNKGIKIKMLKQCHEEFEKKQQSLHSDYITKLQEINLNIASIIEDEAINLGYDIVVTKNIVLSGGDDITNLVVGKIK